MQPVLVSRVDPDSRKNTINEIIRRATSGGEWPQVKRSRCRLEYIENSFIVHLETRSFGSVETSILGTSLLDVSRRVGAEGTSEHEKSSSL